MFRQRCQLSPPKIESTAVLMAAVTFVMLFLSPKSKHPARIAPRLIRNEACHALVSGGAGAFVFYAPGVCAGILGGSRIPLSMRVHALIGAWLLSWLWLPPVVDLLSEAIDGGGVLHREVASLGRVFL